MRHETIEKNVNLLMVLIVIAISIGGLVEIVPLMLSSDATEPDEGIAPYPLPISAHCNRVPVSDGHTECVSLRLGRPATPEQMIEAWTSFAGEPQQRELPSAPRPVIHYLTQPDAPQPRLHRDLGDGMAISVGRLRPCPLLDYRFVTLSHNTVRGAAGGSILLAELAVARGLLDEILGGAVPARAGAAEPAGG